jgi:hypothetical protein
MKDSIKKVLNYHVTHCLKQLLEQEEKSQPAEEDDIAETESVPTYYS